MLTLAGFGVHSLVDGSKATVEEVTPPTEESSAAIPTEHSLTITDRPEEETEILSDGKLTIPQRAEKVKASVVGIVNYQQSSNSYYSTAEAQGSGIIMSEDGYIITNAHVIENAIGLKVVLSDGTEYAAQIVGSDSQTDLAVIKIEATGLTAAEFGNSEQLQVGEQLIAVGNPTGLELGGTLTVGYVSALNRQIDTTSGLNYIQTDAAINPGNSGGALANEYGQVIGINSAKISGEDIEGLGFAIAINDAQPIIDDLINYGYVKGRVRMGIGVYEMDAFMAQLNNAPQGLVVASIEAGTPAASSGLVPGDIITAIDGKDITAYDDISSILEGKQPGDVVVLSVFRRTTGYADKELTIQVELIESVETQAQVQNNYSSGSGSSNSGNSGNYGSYNPYGNFGSYFGIQ
ncbi:MAG: trypsin-like peptidase domain-containing protein [Oscillospiraceae bacterium]|nr:trypsin-like peptidase domain-containing protein [Oscillospiraceae bacterium]